MGAIFSFLGGSAFRMIWGEVSAWFTKKQDHKLELEKIQQEATLSSQKNKEDMARIQLLHDLGIKEITIKADAALAQADADAFIKAMEAANRATGIVWVDAWNASIRPAFATVCLGLWISDLYMKNWIMVAVDLELFFAIVGFFFADRMLGKKGK